MEPATSPSPPPATLFTTGLECNSNLDYSQLPTKWFGTQEQSLLITGLINAGVSAACLLLFLALYHTLPRLRKVIYHPLLSSKHPRLTKMPSSDVYPPRIWWRGLRWLLWPPWWSSDSEYTLELCMMIRFLSMNFRLFVLFAPFAFLIMLPVNGVDPPGVSYSQPPVPTPGPQPPLSPPLQPGAPFAPPQPPSSPPAIRDVKTSWGGLEAISLTHLPPGSPRFYAPVVCMWIFTLLFLALLANEWPIFTELRHQWLKLRAAHTYAVLLRVEPVSTTAAELEQRLCTLFPGEVEAVLPLRRPTAEMREYELTGVWSHRERHRPRSPGQRKRIFRPSVGGPENLCPSEPSANKWHALSASASLGNHTVEGGRERMSSACSRPVAAPRDPHYLALVEGPEGPLLQPQPKQLLPPPPCGDHSAPSGASTSRSIWIARDAEPIELSPNLAPPLSVELASVEVTVPPDDEPVTLQNTWRALLGSAPTAISEMFRSMTSRRELVTMYTALFRTRRAAAAAVQMRSLLAPPVLLRTAPAPQFLDAEWRSLLTPRRTKVTLRVLAWVMATMLFLLWNIPVGIVQGLVQLDTISDVLNEIGLGHIAANVDAITGTRRATIEGWVASLTLALMQLITLYSGLLTFISRLFGFDSWSQVDSRTLHLMFVFNFFLVLLASCIAGSLYATVANLLRSGWCEFVSILGRTLPAQSFFFFNYLLQDALLVTPLVDLLQVVPLLLYALQQLVNTCWCCLPYSKKRHSKNGQFKRRRLRRLPRIAQKLIYSYKYSRAMMVLDVGILFACIAPLTVFFVLLWLLILVPVWSFNLQHVWRPRAGAGFDTGGYMWPSVLRLQTFVLQAAQVVLAGVVLINERVGAFMLLVPLPIVTGLLANSLRQKYVEVALHLPLEMALQIDVNTLCEATNGDHSDNGIGDASSAPLHALRSINGETPAGVRALLGEARGIYTGDAPPVPPLAKEDAPRAQDGAVPTSGETMAKRPDSRTRKVRIVGSSSTQLSAANSGNEEQMGRRDVTVVLEADETNERPKKQPEHFSYWWFPWFT